MSLSPNREPLPTRRQFLQATAIAVAATLLGACESGARSSSATATKDAEATIFPPPTVGTPAPDLGQIRPTEVLKPTAAPLAQASPSRQPEVSRAPAVAIDVKPTPAPPPTPESPTPEPALPAARFIKAQDGKLVSVGNDGQETFRAIGFVAPKLLSTPDASCGADFSETELKRRFKEESDSGFRITRFWAPPYLTKGGDSLKRMEFVLNELYRQGESAIVAIETNNNGDCNGRSENLNASWLVDGYKKPDTSGVRSYRDYAALLAQTFGEHPGVAMWELVDQAKSWNGSSDDPQAMKDFVWDMAEVIKSNDKYKRPVMVGAKGPDLPGFGAKWFGDIHLSPHIDVVSAYFDVRGDGSGLREPIPGPLRTAIDVARDIKKPFVVNNWSMSQGTGRNAVSIDERAQLAEKSFAAIFDKGASAILVWERGGLGTNRGEHVILRDDPTWAVIERQARALRAAS